MKVRELVTPRRVEPVIQIDHFDPREILSSYVLTEDGARLLVAPGEGFLHRLLHPGTRDSFVFLGNYGSGKSHLLAFVDSLLRFPALWDVERHTALAGVAALQGRRFFTVRLKLSEVRRPLDRIVLDAVRDELARVGVPNPFADWWGTVERVHADYGGNPDFAAYLEEGGLSFQMWTRRFAARDESLFGFAEGFLRARGLEPQLSVTPEALVERTLRVLEERAEFGPDTTFVLLVDELSDFVKSREGPERHADLVFLRDLGEAAFRYRFRVLAAVQQDILDPALPEFADVREVLTRITQRFEKRSLASQYLHAVVRERVLTKTPEQRARVARLYAGLREKFPHLQTPEATFTDLYPAHPDVIEVFQALIPYLGNRSVLAYLGEEVSRDAFLDGEADATFLTLDRLFHGLRLEFGANPVLAPLARAYENAERGLPAVEERNRESVGRALSALVAYQAAGRDVTVEELAHATLFGGRARPRGSTTTCWTWGYNA